MGYNGEMPYLDVAGNRLFYSDQGEGDGPALLLLHGAGGSHLVWPAAVRRLAGTRVLALDLPGHGRSAPPGRRTLAHYAAVVTAFVNALGLPGVVLAGHSMGAAIALTVALEPPPALRGLVLLGVGARLRVNDTLLGGALSDLEQAAAFIVDYGFAGGSEEMRLKTRQAIVATGAMTVYGDFLACRHFDARAQLPGIHLPALVISGAADRLSPPREADALAAGLPHARLARLADTGHFSMLERPAEVAALIAAFLDGLRPSAAGQHTTQ